ncbi:hypothetical protein [Vibrio vulnificus]|uniref:hypothetical protein n=1 Tax=Vibrio vulnificus TaxID=672 RepID=UPI003D64E2CD
MTRFDASGAAAERHAFVFAVIHLVVASHRIDADRVFCSVSGRARLALFSCAVLRMRANIRSHGVIRFIGEAAHVHAAD